MGSTVHTGCTDVLRTDDTVRVANILPNDGPQRTDLGRAIDGSSSVFPVRNTGNRNLKSPRHWLGW